MSRMPIITDIPRAAALSTVSAECGDIEHYSADRSLWARSWNSNRSVAEAFGLGVEEFEHILASFPLFAKKRPGFHTFLLERLAEWKGSRAKKRVAARASL